LQPVRSSPAFLSLLLSDVYLSPSDLCRLSSYIPINIKLLPLLLETAYMSQSSYPAPFSSLRRFLLHFSPSLRPETVLPEHVLPLKVIPFPLCL
jgi:hypothetical protein